MAISVFTIISSSSPSSTSSEAVLSIKYSPPSSNFPKIWRIERKIYFCFQQEIHAGQTSHKLLLQKICCQARQEVYTWYVCLDMKIRLKLLHQVNQSSFLGVFINVIHSFILLLFLSSFPTVWRRFCINHCVGFKQNKFRIWIVPNAQTWPTPICA